MNCYHRSFVCVFEHVFWIVEEAKRRRLQKDRELHCEICGFSFYEKYGERGKDFIEAHHTKPVSEMKPGDKTGIEDIALICSNCHRMIHRKIDNLSIEELKKYMSSEKK